MYSVKKRFIYTLASLLFVISSFSLAENKIIKTNTHTLEEVAHGVYLATGNGALFTMSNALIIVNKDDVVVVDSHVTPAASRALLSSIQSITPKPVTTLINSHFHWDHAHGNQSFGRDVQIIGHEKTREKLVGTPLQEREFIAGGKGFSAHLENLQKQIETAENDQERKVIQEKIDFAKAHIEASKEIKPVAPDVTMNDRMTIFRGDREIQLHFFGRAHTAGDIVVYLPKEKLAFTGDMMLGGISFLGDGYVGEWSETLERFKHLDFELMVPGHGPAFTDRKRIDQVQAYYRDLYKKVVEMRDKGLSYKETAAQVDLTIHSSTLGVKKSGASLKAVLRIYELLDGSTR